MYSPRHLAAGAALLLTSMHFCIDHVKCQTDGRGVILTAPETQVVAPGDIAYFNCHARGDSVYWYVNGRDPGLMSSEYIARGFTFIYQETDHGATQLEEHNNTITIEARPENNNTEIACTASGWIYNHHDYRVGKLIIAGTPLSPSISIDIEYVMNDSFLFTLNWSVPFTWPGFPISNYTITLSNYSSTTEPVHTTTILNGTDIELTPPGYQFTTEGNKCYQLGFSVKANNSLGEGKLSSQQFGHPIIIDEVGDIETLITFHSNGTPHFWMSFPAPRICPGYQTGTYNVSIYDTDNYNNAHHVGHTEYTQENADERRLLAHELRSGIAQGGHYEVEVTVESHGVVRSKRESFYSEVLPIYPTSETHEPQVNCGQQTRTVGAAVGTASIFIITALVILLIFLLKYRRSREREFTDGHDSPIQKKSRVRIENTNPIYEGAVYETVPGESLKTLLTPTGSSLSDCTPHYVDPPPSLPPPRVEGEVNMEPEEDIDAIKASIKQDNLLDFQQPDGEYMIMGPNNSKTFSIGKTSSLKLSKSLTHKANEVERQDSEEKYVTLDELRG